MENKKLKVLELFGGICACTKALINLGVNYELVDYVEIDKYAVKSTNAIYNTNFQPQDIRKWNKNLDVDLIMHGSPCQNFSLAGNKLGGDKGSGTQSSLMYETLRIVESLKPKYVIWENVKNLLSKSHIHNFNNYINLLKELGYVNYHKVLNSINFGVPQNRERLFVVSIRNDLKFDFKFPDSVQLRLSASDYYLSTVNIKYYLSYKMKKYIISNNNKWTGNNNKSIVNKTVVSTINTCEGHRRCDASNYICYEKPDNFDLKCVSDDELVNLFIRRLTPLECFRFMGFSKYDYWLASFVNSDTQLYKQAGNSICVPVLEAILKELLKSF